jgi:hypothetical protein
MLSRSKLKMQKMPDTVFLLIPCNDIGIEPSGFLNLSQIGVLGHGLIGVPDEDFIEKNDYASQRSCPGSMKRGIGLTKEEDNHDERNHHRASPQFP